MADSAASSKVSEAIQRFVPVRPDAFFSDSSSYKTVEIFDSFGIHPSILDEVEHDGSITFRVDKDIEFAGFELQGLVGIEKAATADTVEKHNDGTENSSSDEDDTENTSEENEASQSKVQVFFHIGSFYISDINGLIQGYKCQIQGLLKSRYCFPIPLTVALEANKWYTIAFKIKGPCLRYGTGFKKSSAVNVDPFGLVNFEFKDGKNASCFATVMFNALTGGEGDRADPPDSFFVASRYEALGFRKLERKDTGTIKFKVSKSIEMSGLTFFGLKPNSTSEPNAVAIHRIHFQVYDLLRDVCSYHDWMIAESNAGEEKFLVRTSRPVKLDAQVTYELHFLITGPKLRYGLNRAASVTVTNEQSYRKPKPSVTFTFLEETGNCTVVEGIQFRFITSTEEQEAKFLDFPYPAGAGRNPPNTNDGEDEDGDGTREANQEFVKLANTCVHQ